MDYFSFITYRLLSEWVHPLINNDILIESDIVVTLCSDADANCPVLPKNVTKELWGFDDPAGKDWSEFQRVRDEIKAAIETFAHRV